MGPTSFQRIDGVLHVLGDITDPDAAAFRTALTRAGRQSTELDLLDLDLDDGIAVVEAVNAVRELLAHHGVLTLHHAPQMLAHTLYKIGLLESGQLRLISPRVESPTVV